MILDTSALAAIPLGEPEAALFIQLIHAADHCRMSATTLLELSIVIEAQMGPDAGGSVICFSAESALSSNLLPSSRRISRGRLSSTSQGPSCGRTEFR